MAHEPARVAWRSYHDWVLPMRAVQALIAGALLFLVVGLILLAVGGGVASSGLIATGAVLSGIGGCALLVCLLLCLHAYFVFNVRDEAVQTSDHPWADEASIQEIPGYAVINKPSSLKSAETLRRNGGNGGLKKVTMAPDVALDADVRAPALRTTASGDFSHAPNLTPASPTSPGYRTIGSFGVVDGGGAPQGVRTSGGSMMESFDQRSFAQQQQFQNMPQKQHSHQSLQQQQQQQQQQQRNDLDIQQQRQQLEYHRQHLLNQQQQQHHQQRPHHFRVSMQHSPQPQSVTYAQVQRYPVPVQHSPSPSLSSQQSSVFTTSSVGRGAGLSGMGTGGMAGVTNYGVGSGSSAVNYSGVGTGSSMAGMANYSGVGTGSSMAGMANYSGVGTGSSMGTAKTSSSFGSYKIQTQGLHYQSGRPYAEDDDYDNPVERTPMLAHSPASTTTSSTKGVSFSGRVKQGEEDVPEPAPLQHPSERRPMTFEQQSSSKMSIYDNVLFPYAEADGE